jgi:microcystin-dependent protein
MIMKAQFRINKHTQVFNIVGTGYGGMAKFVLEE